MQHIRENTRQRPQQERATAVSTFPREIDERPQVRTNMRWHAPAICAIALLVAWALFLLTGGLATSSIQRTLPTQAFSLNGHGRLVVNETSGSIHIHPGSAGQIVVRGNVHTASLAGSVRDPQVQYVQNGNTVTVTTSEDWMLLSWSEVMLDITTPANVDLSIHTTSANAVIENIAGSIYASASSGNLDLHNTDGLLNLSTSSGDVNLTDERGPLKARTTSGNISAAGLNGTVDLSTTSGNITLAQAQLGGVDQLHTSSGDISFSGALDARGSYRMETSSGNITLQLPAASSFQLNASSNSGELHNEFATDMVGGTPQAHLGLQTSSGNIDIHRQ
ncbi:MAG TPA: DUF4097 family beta strand repeat-containing protein [Ktedonobacteraceae bacterium]|jgi:DUF4097 and DUF4098 domain-containing protein YvlB